MPRLRPPSAACVLAAAALLAALPAHAAPRGRRAKGVVVLDGVPTPVRWTDGDTFRVEGGPRRGDRVRLLGVNALETYGPVHRWGRWTGEGLERIADAAAPFAAARAWECTATGARRDGYGRTLAACPGLALALVQAGLAMVFAVDAPPDPALVAAQREAQAAGTGMWAGGVPEVIVTSAHSAGEPGLGRRGAYDRVADPRTGITTARRHGRVYAACEEVCAGEGAGRSCLTYVPYERRYRDRPACLGGRAAHRSDARRARP